MKRNKNSIKRFLALLLSAAMIITYMPSGFLTYAEETAPVTAEETVKDAPEAEAPAAAETPQADEQDDVKDEPAEETSEKTEDQQETANPEKPSKDEAGESGDSSESADTQEPAVTEEEQPEEPAETPEEPAPEEEKYPAQSFEGKTPGLINGVKVFVDAPEGAFPEGTRMEVANVSAGEVEDAVKNEMGEGATVVKAVDITFYDKEGNKIEPKGDKPISVRFSHAKFDDDRDLSVVHIEGKSAEKVADSVVKTEGKDVTFEADQFSIYVIVENETVKKPRYTYHFMVPNSSGDGYAPYQFLNKAGETTDIQIVKNGEAVEAVTDPEVPSNKMFVGWYVLNDDKTATTNQKIEFGSAVSVSEDKDIYVGAKFSDAYLIYFYDNVENSDPAEGILAKKIVAVDGNGKATVNIGDVEAAPVTSTQKFVGWKLGETEYRISDGTTVEVTADQVTNSIAKLYPVFLEGRWLRFVSGDIGASGVYVDGIFVEHGTTHLGNLPTTTREGFTFAGWYKGTMSSEGKISYGDQVTNANGAIIDEAALLNALESDDVTLYAKWTGKPVSYRVMTWYQNADDDEYSFQGVTTVENATSGETTNVTAPAVSGFVAKPIEQQTIAGDGSTVVNVFYDRAIYEVKFFEKQGSYYYTRWVEIPSLTISAKYGADIHDQWPGVKEGTENYPTTWYYSQDQDEYAVGITTMPLNGAEYYEYNTSGRYTLRTVWNVQRVNGSNNFDIYTVASYKSSTSEITKSAADFTPIKGFTLNAASQDDATRINNASGAETATYNNSYTRSVRVGASYGRDGIQNGSTYTLNFYYLRNKYNIVFEENGGPAVADATSIYYEADISSKKPANYVSADEAEETGGTPTTKTVNGIVYVFQGWYDNQELATMDELPDTAQPFDFEGKTMDAGDLVLYARWSKGKYRVNVDPNGGEIKAANNSTYFNVIADETISRYNISRNYAPSSTGTYRYMTDTIARKQYYIPADQALTEGQSYVDDVRYAPVPESEYSIIGWYEVVDGQMSSTPFDFSTHISHDTTIRAKWRRTGTFTLRYDTHMSGDGIDVVADVIGDETDFSDASKTTLTAVPRNIVATGTSNKFVFVGWKDVDGNLYKAGDEFVISAEQANAYRVITLTAVYEEAEKSEETTSITSITFNSNEGDSSKIDKRENLHVNEAINLKTDAPEWTREGYKLVGWNTDKAAATAGTALYDSTFTVGVDNEDPADNTLYAVWRQIIEVEVTGDTKEYEYDGTTKTAGPYNVTYKVGGNVVAELPDGVSSSIDFALADDSDEGATIDSDNKLIKATNLGDYKATVTVNVNCNNPAYYLDEEDESQTADVTLKIIPNTSEVVVTITGNKGTEVYNGETQKVEGYTYSAKAGETAIANSEFTVALKEGKKAEASGKNVGTYKMGLDKDGADFDVTSANYSNIKVVVVDGELEITPITDEVVVTITGNKGTEVYNGETQKVEGYTYSAKAGETAIANSEFTVALKEGKKAEASGKNVGTYKMGLDKDGADFDVTSANYSNIKVVVVDGELEITPITDEVVVTITGNKGTEVYNGETQKVEGYTYSAKAGETAIANSEFTVALKEGKKAEASGKNVGTYKMGLDKDGADFDVTSANYSNIKVVVVDGELEITPITDEVVVTITGNKGTEVYNGETQKVEGYTYSAKAGETAIANSEFTVALKEGKKAEASGKNVGTYKMGLDKDGADFDVTSANYSNIKVVVVDGELEITPITDEVVVTITGNKGTEVYNGETQKVEGYTYSAKAGETAIANSEFTVALKEGKKAEASGKNVGTYKMGLDKDGADFDVTSANYSNIKVVVVDGELEITPITDEVVVTITGNKGTEVYNGETQKVEGYTYSAKAGETAIANSEFTVALKEGKKAEASGKNVGTYKMGLDKDGADFDVTSANYSNIKVVVVDGELEITPITDEVVVTITGNKGTEVYNGETQKVEGYTYSAKAGETAIANSEFTVALKEGKKAEASGKNVGTYKMGLDKDGADFDVTSANYSNIKVVVVDGSLEITPSDSEFEIALNDSKYTYDAKSHCIVPTEGMPSSTATSGETTFSYSFTEDGEYVSDLSSLTKTNAGDYTVYVKGTNPNYSNIATTTATLTIDRANATITADDKTKQYGEADPALTISSTNAEALAIVKGIAEVLVARETGEDVGEYEITITGGPTQTQNFNITYEKGKFSITPVTETVVVTITEHSDEVTYNGKLHTISGYDVKTSNNLYTEDDFKYVGNKEKLTVSKTDAGSYEMDLQVSDFENTSKNFTDVKFVIVDGSLVINKAAVTLKSADLTKEYDGKALVNGDTPLATETGWAEGEGATYTFTGSQTVVGTSNNAFSYTLKANTKADNYTITKNEGTLNVTSRDAQYEVTVTAASAEATYDGKKHAAKGVTNTVSEKGIEVTAGDLTYYVTGLTTEDPEQTDAGTYSNNITGTPVVKDAEGNVVTDQFKVKTVNGSLVINKAAVTLKSADLTKEYDGKALVNGDTPLATETGWAEGEGATYTFTGSQTVVGTSNNAFSYTLKANTKADNYTITKNEGTLNVTSRDAQYEVTVTAASAEATYDGKKHAAKGVTNTVSEKGIEVTAGDLTYYVTGLTTEDPEQTDAGTYSNNITGTPVVKDAEGNVVTDQFKVKTVNGSLKIAKRKVTLTSASGEKEYDGKPLVKNAQTDITVGGDGFAAGEGATYDITGSRTLVGSSENTFTYTLNEGTKAANYTITTSNGTLTVKNRDAKYAIEVESNSAEEKYDGTEKTAEGFKTLEFTVDGNKYTVSGLTAKVAKTDAGEYENAISGTPVVKDAAGNDVTAQFAVSTKAGKLVIGKRTVVMTSADGTKEYDGKPLVKNAQTDVTVTGDGFAEGEGATYNITGSQTIVGTSPNTFTYTLNAGTSANNYEISTVEGALTVTNRGAKYEIELVANSNTGNVYDGKVKSAKGVETDKFTINGVEYTVSGFTTSDPEEKNAGTYANTITAEKYIVTDPDGNDVSDQFAVTAKNGTLEITRKAVTVKADDKSKVYGTEDPELTATITGLVTGEPLSLIKYIAERAAGEAAGHYDINVSGDAVQGNYDVTYEKGDFEITKASIEPDPENPPQDPDKPINGRFTVEGPEDTVYNGKDQKQPLVITDTETGKKLVEGTDFTLTYPEDIKNVGDKPVIVTGIGNYDGTVTLKYKITKKPLTITADSDKKVYDGEALTKNSYTATDLADGDKFDSVTVTGSQTEVGNSPNVPSKAKIVDAASKDMTDNYEIKYANGTLTVTAAEISDKPEDPDDPQSKPRFTVSEPDDTKYNGNEQKQPVTVHDNKTGKDLVEGTDFTLTYSDDVTNAGEVTVTVTGIGNYSGTVERTYDILKRDVNLKSESATKTYDGTALEKPEVTVSGDGFVDKDVKVSPEAIGSIINAGSVTNTIAYEVYEEVAKNYNVTKDEGTLTVTKATIIDPENPEDPEDPDAKRYEVSQPEDVVYNGKDQKQPITVTDTKTGKDLVEGTDMTVSYSDDTKNVGTVTITVKGEGNYDGTVTRTYKIKPMDLTITADSDSKVYDGTALTKDSYTATDLADGDKFDSVTVTGSQTEAGKSDNVPSDAKIVDEAGADMTANYSIKYVNGTLEVTAAEITDEPEDPEDPSSKRFEVSTPDDVKYNGEEQKQPVTVHDNKADKDLVEGTDFELVYSDNTIDVGGVTVTVKGIGNYTGTVDRHYQITPRDLTLTSASAEKPYDGTPLVRNEQSDVTISGDGLAKRDEGKLTFNITGSQTYVGSSDNTFTYDWAEESEESYGVLKAITDRLAVYAAAENANYNVEVKFGTLTVTDKGVNPDDVVTKIHADKTYKVGDIVEFRVSATNIYDEVKTITLEEKAGVELATSVFENVEPGQTVTTTAYYTITEKDAKAGEFENVIKASFSGEDTPFENTDVVDDIEPLAEDDVTNGPKTGDDNNIGGWLALMALAAAGGTGLVVKRRREDDEE